MAASRRRECEERLRAERERVRRNEEHALRVFSSRRPSNVTLRQFALVILRYHAALFKFGGLRQQSIEILVLLWTFGELRRGNLIDVLHSDKDSLSRALVPLTERNMIAADGETLRMAESGVDFLRPYLDEAERRCAEARRAEERPWTWAPRFDRRHAIRRHRRNRPHGGETAH